MEKMDIFALVDELQEEIEMSPTRGFSKNKSVDPKIVMEIIEDIKNVLHDELDTSRRIMTERDQIIHSAEIQAADMMKRAKREADELVMQEEVMRTAQDRSTRLIEQSKKKAQEIKDNAVSYAESILEDMEQYFRDSLRLNEQNKGRLYGKTDPVITPKEEVYEAPVEEEFED